ncbi:hypothetical protein OKA04_11275 [Luteolibacter flavescens]|uniref:Uncharacterized protein n=1 Tax=Luteolibacter flavescens TaxID=1859460 RepID=A0ABT3FP18_9BACT|nr:hypothetical protein [Luteolibacter flavescens]MCW1885312.1 hypothetical protein [Luteolibacter flavescens]
MTKRYEIEEMLSQDDRGVAFRGRDREEKRDVVLRRFFPNGRDGGGLQPEEQPAFLEAVEKLKALKLKELRKTLDGGCDPVDGIPFLVTEWVEGDTLGSFTRGKPLESGSVKDIVEVALKASIQISGVLGHEILWVGCGEESIVVPESGRGITFWVSPLASLNTRGLVPLAELAERLLGGEGRPVQHDATSNDLAGWIQRIRANPQGWSLTQALDALQNPVPYTAPAPAPVTPTQRAPMAATKQGAVATKQAMASPRNAPKQTVIWPWVSASILFCLLLAGGGVMAWKKGKFDSLLAKVDVAPAKKSQPTLEEIRRDLAAKTAPITPGAAQEKQAVPPGWNAAGPAPTGLPSSPPSPSAGTTAPAAATPPPPRVPSGSASLSGKISHAYDDKGGSGIRYLELEMSDKNTRYVAYRTAGGQLGLEVDDLKALKGKNARVTGEFLNDSSRGQVLFIMSRGDIVEVP